jgi:hypothetical protein
VVAIAKKELGLEKSLYEILQILSVSSLEQTSLDELLIKNTLTQTSQNLQIDLNLQDF